MLCVAQVETFAAKKWRVIATARDPSKADKLQALAKANVSAYFSSYLCYLSVYSFHSCVVHFSGCRAKCL